MSSIIEWKNATEIIEILKQQNAMVAGMSVAEAALALGFTKTASGIYVKTIVTTTATAVTSTTATAAAGGVAGATTSAGNLVLFESAAGTASVGGLGSIVAPVALSIAAGVGGYLAGNKLYEENEDFLDKLMFPIYDFFTGQNIADSLYENDVPTVPMIFDQNGNTFMDSRFTGKVKELFDIAYNQQPFTNIPVPNDSFLEGTLTRMKITGGQQIPTIKISTNDSHFQYFDSVLDGYTVDMVHFLRDNEGHTNDDYHTFFSSKDGPFKYNFWNQGRGSENYATTKVSNYIDIDGVGYWYGRTNPDLYYRTGWTVTPNITYARVKDGISWSYEDLIRLIYSIPLDVNDNTEALPAEVIKYTPGQSDVEPITFPDEVPQWTPVAIPEPAVVPNTMPTPIEYPDPSPRPEKITPYINPVQPQPENVPIKKPDPDFKPMYPIIPVPNPIPDTSTEPVPPPDASKDPSQGLKPSTQPQQVPTEIPEPGDTGVTPTPILPIVPPITSEATGLLHVYNPTNAQINEFGSWLWTTFSGDLMETLSKLFNNPMDAVIGLHEIYCTPSTGENSTIKAGFLDSEVPSRLVSSRYVNISCGAVGVPEYWNNYLDYSPYTKAYCYLPFIGIVELNADDIVGSGVEISYKIDTYNGSCIAMITTAKPGSPESVTYQFSGNCAVEVPITSGMKSAIQGALLGASVAGFASAIVTGGGGAVLGATAVGSLRGASNSKNSVQYSGSFGSSYGAMGIKTPYLIIKRPKQKVVYGYNENYGYPAHKMVHIAKCSGYLKAIEVDVISPTATEDEKKLIEEQLKSGIFVD